MFIYKKKFNNNKKKSSEPKGQSRNHRFNSGPVVIYVSMANCKGCGKSGHNVTSCQDPRAVKYRALKKLQAKAKEARRGAVLAK
jgi:hypothetical protein